MPSGPKYRKDSLPVKKEKKEFRNKPDRFPDIHGDGAPRGAAGALIELDKELMKLLVRRAKLVSRIRGGKGHAATPQAILEEKSVRTAWETNSLSFSKDPRFCRQLFNLLQDLQVLSKEESEGGSSFALAPSKQPVDINIAAPNQLEQAQIWSALGAGLGQKITLFPLSLAEGLLDFCKAWNQAGAKLDWQKAGVAMGTVTSDAGGCVGFAGKTVYAGDSLFSLYLLALVAASGVGVTSFTGGTTLKSADLSPLRHVLPLLGSRLAHKIPRSVGLPATLECSGVLPEEVTAPGDLPYEGVCALLVAPLIWKEAIRVDLSLVPAPIASAALLTVEDIYAQSGAPVEVEGSVVSFSSSGFTLPEEPVLQADAALSGYLLALPVFLGGECTLQGRWGEHTAWAADVQALLGWAGAEIRVSAKSVSSSCQGALFAKPLQDFDITGALAPLYYALAAKAVQVKKEPVRLVILPDDEERHLVEGFYSRIGLQLDGDTVYWVDGSHVEKSTSGGYGRSDKSLLTLPWTSPCPYWSMAFSLVAIIRPGLRLANPHEVSSFYPGYWGVYNTLPKPHNPAAPSLKKGKDDESTTPARRRIITG